MGANVFADVEGAVDLRRVLQEELVDGTMAVGEKDCRQPQQACESSAALCGDCKSRAQKKGEGCLRKMIRGE